MAIFGGINIRFTAEPEIKPAAMIEVRDADGIQRDSIFLYPGWSVHLTESQGKGHYLDRLVWPKVGAGQPR